MTTGIPPAIDTDVEDVAWALQTAASLWSRNERVDAIVWLRRAAQAAGDAEHDERALTLARGAAELSDWIAKNPLAPASNAAPVPSSIPPNDSMTGGVDDLLKDIPIEAAPAVSLSAPTAPHAFMPMNAIPPVVLPPPLAPPPPIAPLAPPAPLIPLAPTTSDLIPISESSNPVVFQSVASERTAENVQSAEEAHAGLLDPWATTSEEELPSASASISPISSIASSEDDDDDVVTSARLMLPPAEPAMVMAAPPLPAQKPPPPKPPPIKTSRPPAPALPPDPLQGFSEQPTKVDPPSPEMVAAAREAAARIATPPAPAPVPPVVRYQPETTLVSAGIEKKDIDLAGVEELADLPEDARTNLERSGHVHHLSRDEEVMGFGLAFVIEGFLDVAAQIVDVPAHRIEKGAVLKAKGTVAESVPLRLICASDKAVVATWDAQQIEPAFKTCPWVEDDLRDMANHVQALVGVTLGPLADRLDATLRAQVTSRLELRELAEGDVIVEAGHPVRDLCLVGQGTIELVKDDAVIGEVGAGEFLFASEIVGGGKAHATARVGKGGALLLASDRAVAQELMMTCPPLLEIFAGM